MIQLKAVAAGMTAWNLGKPRDMFIVIFDGTGYRCVSVPMNELRWMLFHGDPTSIVLGECDVTQEQLL